MRNQVAYASSCIVILFLSYRCFCDLFNGYTCLSVVGGSKLCFLIFFKNSFFDHIDRRNQRKPTSNCFLAGFEMLQLFVLTNYKFQCNIELDWHDATNRKIKFFESARKTTIVFFLS